ncbi:VOC family protein [Micromonospora zamorensis]|uniref:VOC family protein n=1 Tax=Micromonospora zamorensis TaxID=709883 RepID=UPI003411AFBC
MLGGSITKTENHHFLAVDGFPAVVDLATDDLASADRAAFEAGARRLRPTDDADLATHQGSRVYASPAGHPFCLRPA